MKFPERFSNLPAHAWPRLRALLDVHSPGGDVINMTIGEPKHAFPAWVTQVISDNAAGFNSYPPNEGSDALRGAIADWIKRRYGVDVDAASQIMALNGTREGLYNAAMALCPETKNGKQPVVLTPNPFYQVYMVAAISVGAEPVYVPATAETGHLPDFAALPADVLDRTTIAYVCSPANPQGAVADDAYWRGLIDLAEKHDFQIFADECYSEIYRDTRPDGCDRGGQRDGGRSRTRADFPFAVQTIQPARIAIRLCGGRPRKHPAHPAIAQLCGRAAAVAVAGGCRSRLG